MKRLLLLFFVVIFAGCNVSNSTVDELKEVNFKTDENSYSLNAVITVTLVNHAKEKVGFNLSCSRLQRKRGDDWVKVKADGVCLLYMKVIQSGEKARYNIDLGSGYNLKKTGTYRIITEVMFRGENFKLATELFTLIGPFKPL